MDVWRPREGSGEQESWLRSSTPHYGTHRRPLCKISTRASLCVVGVHLRSTQPVAGADRRDKKGLKRLACGAIHSKPFSLLLVDCHACLQKTRQVCPLLLRCFWTQQRHRRGEDYSNINNLPRDELQIYTWCVCCVHTYTRRDSVCS